MGIEITDRLRGLTEKERTTLRLMLRGHDAKSIARSQGLSVHTINERLRDARRKLEVSSSREAARLLFEAEAAGAARHPELPGDRKIGEDVPAGRNDQGAAPIGVGRIVRPWIIVGGLAMTFALGLLALATFTQLSSAPEVVRIAATQEATEESAAARQWLELLDESRWEDSYRATGSAFRKLNTLQVWTDVSDRVRTPMGAVVSRTLLGQEFLPAPPAGYEVVKFRTLYANKAEPVVETVTLEREGDRWMIVGVTVG